MADTFVAADASPLIGLAAAGAFDLLRRLFGRITVTTVVRDEVTAGVHLPGAHETTKAIADGWIDVVRGPQDLTAFAGLDPGEASTIALALAHSGRCLVLIDEPFGRTYAQARGVAVTGLAGVLLAAKRAGFVPESAPSSTACRQATSAFLVNWSARSSIRPAKRSGSVGRGDRLRGDPPAS